MRFFFFFLIMHKVHFYPFLNSRKEKKEKNRGKREEKKTKLHSCMDWYILQNLVLIKDKDKAKIRGRYKK